MAKNGFADDTPREYIIPETAHLELIQLRAHLRLLIQLTEAGTNASRHDVAARCVGLVVYAIGAGY